MKIIIGLLYCVLAINCISASAQIKAHLPKDKPVTPAVAKPKVKPAVVPNKVVAEKQSATKVDWFNYIRSKVLIFNTNDGYNGYADLKFDEGNETISIYMDNGEQIDIFFGNLDANTVFWDVYNPENNSGNTDNRLLRLTISAKSGSIARNWYPPSSSAPSKTHSNKIATITFILSETAKDPNFQDKMNRAVKTLIALCGGEKERKDPFAE